MEIKANTTTNTESTSKSNQHTMTEAEEGERKISHRQLAHPPFRHFEPHSLTHSWLRAAVSE